MQTSLGRVKRISEINTVELTFNRQYTKQRGIRLQFTLSNIQAEYEALINELLWAKSANIKKFGGTV